MNESDTSDIIIKNIKYKLVITIATIYLFVLFMLLLHDKLNEIERKINGTYEQDK